MGGLLEKESSRSCMQAHVPQTDAPEKGKPAKILLQLASRGLRSSHGCGRLGELSGLHNVAPDISRLSPMPATRDFLRGGQVLGPWSGLERSP